MKRLGLIAAAAALATPATGAEPDYAPFRACVWEIENPTDQTIYHHCTAPLVQHCGASKTALEAVSCIEAARDALEDQTTREMADLPNLSPLPPNFPEAGIDVAMDELELSRDTGAAACVLVAERDEDAGVKVGQRAVNTAFCQLMAVGDVYGLLTQFKRP